LKIRQLSDLHLERGPFTYKDEGEDVVVLAGDIDNGIAGIEWAKTIPKPVTYVAGNHDHWGCDLIDNIEAMRAAAAGSNVHFLECDEVVMTINDESVRFLGTTLWTDYCEAYLIKHGQYYDADMQREMMYLAERSMNDFRQITYQQEPLTPKILLEMHHKSRAWLKSKIDERFNGQTVVVTHHAPSYQSLIHANDVKDYELDQIIKGNRRPDYAHERIASYASDLEDLVSKVDCWLHGHIHEQMMYNIGKCLVVTNPRGYIRGPQKSNFWWHMR
jgi:predicted phosphodiesterase